MSPHPQNFDCVLIFNYFINQPMLNIDASRIGSSQVSHQFFVGRRVLKRISLKHIEEALGFLLKIASGQLFGIFIELVL
jgi:hypothetical protein